MKTEMDGGVLVLFETSLLYHRFLQPRHQSCPSDGGRPNVLCRWTGEVVRGLATGPFGNSGGRSPFRGAPYRYSVVRGGRIGAVVCAYWKIVGSLSWSVNCR